MKRLLVVLFACVFTLASANVFAADKTRIAVASEGKNTNSQVSGVAAKSPYFLIFDETGHLIEEIENPHKNASGMAASLVIQLLTQKGVTHFVAGTFGKNMIDAMKAKGIAYMEFKGNADEALKNIRKK